MVGLWIYDFVFYCIYIYTDIKTYKYFTYTTGKRFQSRGASFVFLPPPPVPHFSSLDFIFSVCVCVCIKYICKIEEVSWLFFGVM